MFANLNVTLEIQFQAMFSNFYVLQLPKDVFKKLLKILHYYCQYQ